MPETRPNRFLLTLLVLLSLAATVAAWFDLRQRNDVLVARLEASNAAQERLERAVQLFRFERGSKGLGVAALIEQLRHWAPLLDLSTTPQHEIPRIKQRVEDILSAFADLGADAFDALNAAWRSSIPGKDDELTRWILEAMARVDQPRTVDVLVTCLRGLEVPVSNRIRIQAGNQLLALDKARAAKELSGIVEYETAAGIDVGRLPPDIKQQLAASKVAPQPLRMFFNLVDLLVAAQPEGLDDKLIMIATRPDQDRMTVQACVRHLGELKSKRAVKAIKRLYEKPPEMTLNPIFQNHCLDAIAQIEGADACDYFRDQLRKQPDESVATKLQSLIKTHCP
ncbi:MAG: hypothetical protein R3F56_06110 [Planctomycetota bacterium]